ncbi:MAG: hypothetical protein HY360_07245 [Verrucomicrobia bacterium]|nr:hypothetical protein [Verrucomicrobiota bacterium]
MLPSKLQKWERKTAEALGKYKKAQREFERKRRDALNATRSLRGEVKLLDETRAGYADRKRKQEAAVLYLKSRRLADPQRPRPQQFGLETFEESIEALDRKLKQEDIDSCKLCAAFRMRGQWKSTTEQKKLNQFKPRGLHKSRFQRWLLSQEYPHVPSCGRRPSLWLRQVMKAAFEEYLKTPYKGVGAKKSRENNRVKRDRQKKCDTLCDQKISRVKYR